VVSVGELPSKPEPGDRAAKNLPLPGGMLTYGERASSLRLGSLGASLYCARWLHTRLDLKEYNQRAALIGQMVDYFEGPP